MTAEAEIIERLDTLIELLQDMNKKLEEIEENTNNINGQLADKLL